jgi:phosphatidate cytidylyltransferase
MRTRVISAAVLVPAVALVFWLGHPFILFGVLLLTALAAYEVAGLVRAAGLPANTAIAVITAPAAVLGLGLTALPRGLQFYDDTWIFISPAVAVWLIGIGALSLVFSDPATGFRAWVGNLVATLYPTLLGFLAFIASLGYRVEPADNLREMFGAGRLWLLILVLTVWSLDSAAYVVGRYYPRGHFFNHISPKKTWSGAIGGTVAAIGVCAVLGVALLSVNVVIGALTGLLIAVAAQAGDLVESMLKRAAGAKDSGTLIPGHGGILDRVDSFLFAGPVLYALLLALMHNGQAGI